MYDIDPSKTDLVAEFRNNPGGPFSPELTLVVNRLRLMPMADRHILVCTQRGREWTLAKCHRIVVQKWNSSKTRFLTTTTKVYGKFSKGAGKR